MVQIIPQKTNVGTQIGQALGKGVQGGMEQGFQRGLLQQALGKVRALSQQENVKPLDLAIAFMEAGSGIHGSERYLAPLLPMILNTQRAENLFGRTNQAPSNIPQALGGPGVGAAQPELGLRNIEPGQRQLGGFLPPIKTPQEMQSFASQYAQELNDPNAYQSGLSLAEAQNAQAQAANNQIAQMAISTKKVKPEDLPEFMQVAQKYGNLKDPNEIVTSGVREFSRYKNLKDKLERIPFPNIFQEIGRKGVAGPVVKESLKATSRSREEILRNAQPTIKDLVNLGFEDEVRKTLAKKGLSPTEVSIAINPLSRDLKKNISEFPSYKSIPPAIKNEKLVNFMERNITPTTSILGIRDELVSKKGVPWQEVGPSIREAMERKGFTLTPEQNAEMATVENEPPRQSLEGIFSSMGGILNYLRGQK